MHCIHTTESIISLILIFFVGLGLGLILAPRINRQKVQSNPPPLRKLSKRQSRDQKIRDISMRQDMRRIWGRIKT